MYGASFIFIFFYFYTPSLTTHNEISYNSPFWTDSFTHDYPTGPAKRELRSRVDVDGDILFQNRDTGVLLPNLINFRQPEHNFHRTTLSRHCTQILIHIYTKLYILLSTKTRYIKFYQCSMEYVFVRPTEGTLVDRVHRGICFLTNTNKKVPSTTGS